MIFLFPSFPVLLSCSTKYISYVKKPFAVYFADLPVQRFVLLQHQEEQLG